MEYAVKNNNLYESIIFKSNIIQTVGKANITLQARLNLEQFTNYKNICSADVVTKIDLPVTADLKLISKQPFSYTMPGMAPKYFNKHKIEDYLYEISYGCIDYDYADKYFRPIYGGCSAIRNRHLIGRNFDWYYDKHVQFIVNTPKSLDHLAVLGVSGIIPGITQDNVDLDNIIIDDVDMFKLLPFYLLDEINECDVFCTYNITPIDENTSLEILAKIQEKERICIPMLVRFILDKFTNAELAIKYITNYVTLYFPKEMIDAGYLCHFMLGDNSHTYIIEFIDDEIKVSCAEYITNFQIYKVLFNKDRTIKYPPTLYGINKYGAGLERWNLIATNYAKCNTLDGMSDILEKIKYSNCYDSENFWYSETVKMLDDNGSLITVDTNPSICQDAKHKLRIRYYHKNRETAETWITCHSSIYDIKTKILYIKNQEGNVQYKFNLI